MSARAPALEPATLRPVASTPAERRAAATGGAPAVVAPGPARLVVADEIAQRLGAATLWEGALPALEARQPAEGRPLVWLEGRARTTLVSATAAGPRVWFDADDWLERLTAGALWTPRPPFWSRLPFHPHLVPPALRALARRGLARGEAAAPAALVADELARAIHAVLEPDAPPAALTLVLSHDTESAAGQEGLARLWEVEERAGVRSCAYVVSGRFPIDDALLAGGRRRGFEIGHHDHYHDYRTAYLPPPALAARLAEARPFCERYDVRGFRAPGWYRTPALFSAAAARYAYDSSFPSFRAGTRPSGCFTRRPFLLGGVPVVPLTAPADGELLARGLGAADLVRVWRGYAAAARAHAPAGGLLHLLTHPEPGFTASRELIDAYAEVLHELAATPGVVCRLPSAVAEAAHRTLAS